jgi:hypothetical protein
MMKTKGDLVRFGIAFAMRKLRFKRAPLGLSEEQRYALADDAVKEMQAHGGWKELSEPLEPWVKPPP